MLPPFSRSFPYSFVKLSTVLQLSWLREKNNQYGNTPDDYLSRNEEILEKYERITESEVYDRIFENGIDSSTNTLFISTYGFNHPFTKRGNVKALVKNSLRCTDDIVHMILSSEELEEFCRVISDSHRKFVGIIYDLDLFSPEEMNTIYNLLSERNITLLIGIHFGLNAEPYDRFTRRVHNIVLGETAGSFNSECIIGRREPRLLRKKNTYSSTATSITSQKWKARFLKIFLHQ